MSIGDNIRLARINSKLNQKELADKLKERGIIVGNTTISNWENGTSKPDPDTIEEICRILGVDGNYILGFKNNNDCSNSISELEMLFNKHKNILTPRDEAIIKTIFEERIKEIDRERGEE